MRPSESVSSESAEPPCPTAPPASRLGRVLVPLGAAVCLLPVVSTSMALVAGLVVAVTVGNPHAATTRRATQVLLSLSVVGLGAGMDLRTVVAAGAHGAGDTVVGIAVCLALGALLTRLLRVVPGTGLLISVGTAICGGSAIAAVAPVMRAKDDEVSVALGTVFLLNAVALLVFPVVGRAVGLDAERFGLWCALAIHDTSSVVGAAMSYGPSALAVATPVKLARALWIVPLTLGLGVWRARREGGGGTLAPAGRAKRPWFILGFLGAAALVTAVPVLRPVGQGVAAVARQTLVLTLFLIGANLTRGALRAVGLRPLVLGVVLWVVMASASLGALVSGLIA
ncbi:putative sulfate exporter family transporter [Corallococcus sp. H22C18031201]|uniref:YeiH family protein n=1 Tax=Citreicoccus inhibens TaxID=2849499 RepID=UPI000E75AC9E|nr:putative sulfate exporter family transporter [Citreicoccus inhibens]MBU8894112.1 YeiH family protein [Citreicoccus inhibens]RJS23177.1 putative sulfate exporter family transporter [Corallococcus sp. H22C18031201]